MLIFKPFFFTNDAAGVVGLSFANTLLGRTTGPIAMNRSMQTATSRTAQSMPQPGPSVVYRSRSAQRRLARTYPSTVDPDEILRNRRLTAGSLLTYRE